MLSRRRFAACGVLCVTAAAAALAALAQPTDPPGGDDLKTVTNESADFLAGLSINPADAYKALLAGGPLAGHADTMLAKTQELRKYGAFPAGDKVEFIHAQRLGRDVVLLKYLQKFERMPVVWHFTWYRPDADTGWTLISVRFDTELELLGLAVRGGDAAAKTE